MEYTLPSISSRVYFMPNVDACKITQARWLTASEMTLSSSDTEYPLDEYECELEDVIQDDFWLRVLDCISIWPRT